MKSATKNKVEQIAICEFNVTTVINSILGISN